MEVWGGIECSVNRVDNNFFDQLDYTGHYHRTDDISAFGRIGFKKFRYPILWETHQPEQAHCIEWSDIEIRLNELRNNGIDVIAGLVHHGSGPAFVNILDESFVNGLVDYARKVTEKFPWIEYYTPINEPLTTARFCGLYGLWYPHQNNDTSFCRILINECRAIILVMQEIRKINPAAKLVQTDDLGKVHSTPLLQYQADFENDRCWLSYDLLCGKVDEWHPLYNYLLGSGVSETELEFFLQNSCQPSIMGFNYYLTSERYLDQNLDAYPQHTHGGNGRYQYADVEAVRVGAVCPGGIQQLLKVAWCRYKLPLAVTEMHLHCTREEQMRWTKHVWESANELTTEGIEIVAITAWALLGSFGWDRLLTSFPGTYEPGIFDISGGGLRPTVLCAMLHAYSQNKVFVHPALASPGWWHRSCRVAYGYDQFFLSYLPSGQHLTISGVQSGELSHICRNRGLQIIEDKNVPSTRNLISAAISVDDSMVISCDGREDLIIFLAAGKLFQCLNGGLDLLLDGETGNWELSLSGRLVKRNPDVELIRQIAS